MSKSTKTRGVATKRAPSQRVADGPAVGASPTVAVTQMMSGGQALVEQLLVNGVDTVFGLPGAQMYPFFDALQQRADCVRTVGARHEQGTAYMAFGYARSTGRPGVCSVVPGPGVLNASAALATAMGTATPVLCVTGQVPSQFIGRGRGHLHELPDQLGTLRSFIKWAGRIERPADAPRILNEAFRHMLSGRPGVVCVEMAWDTMAAVEDVALLPAARIDQPPPPSSAAIEAAAMLLAKARRPIIFVGSGAQHARAEVSALAEALDAPVTAFRGGRGVVADGHPLAVSCATARMLWTECDAVIGIGTRLELPYMRWTGMMELIDRPQTPALIRIDIDPAEMSRLIPQVAVVADAAHGAAALALAVGAHRGKTLPVALPVAASAPSRRTQITAARDETQRKVDTLQPQMAYLDVIRACLPRDGILVEELCQVGFVSNFGYQVYEPRTYISCGHQGTLGFGFQTALGVKIANPDRHVVSITGDGGFLFGVQELATARQENIAVVTIVFNNASYGNVLRDQRERYEGRVNGAILQNPDFQLLAQAFGVDGARVTSPEALRPVLAQALAAGRPALIEVVVPQGSEASPWKFLM